MKTSLKAIAYLAALAVLVTVISCSGPAPTPAPTAAPAPAPEDKLQGVWKITQVTLAGPSAASFTPIESDTVIFTKKYASFAIVASQTPRAALPEKGATDAQKLAVWAPFFAGVGTYEIDGTTITSHGIIGKEPVKPGSSATMDFKFEGDALLLTTKTDEDGPVATPYTMKLERLE